MTKKYTFIIDSDKIEIYSKGDCIPLIKDISILKIKKPLFTELLCIKKIEELIFFLRKNEEELIQELKEFIEETKIKALTSTNINKKLSYFNLLINMNIESEKKFLFDFSKSIELLDKENIKKILKNKDIKRIYFQLIKCYNIEFINFCVENNLIQIEPEMYNLTSNIFIKNNNYEKLLFKRTGLFDMNSNKLDLLYISDEYFLDYVYTLIKNKSIHIGCLIKNMNILILNILKNDEYIYFIKNNLNQLLELPELLFEEKINILFDNVSIDDNYGIIIDIIDFLIKNNKEYLLNNIIKKTNDNELKNEIECGLTRKQMSNF